MQLNFDNYLDKMRGCWNGKNIGGTLGAPFEGMRGVFDVRYYTQALDKPLPNDDLDLQLVWLNAVEKYGSQVNSQILSEYWISFIGPNWSEYGAGKNNLRMGLLPPLSGYVGNRFRESNGSWILTELWACLCPGHPELAVRYAYEDACVDHSGEGVNAAIFIAAIESAAFVISDTDTLLDIGLSYLPDNSAIHKAVACARACHENGLSWQQARKKLLQELPCSFSMVATLPSEMEPDEPVGEIGYDAPCHMGLLVMAWLYGEGSFDRSICIAASCGEDSDCTAGTLAAILGIVCGNRVIDEKWLRPLGGAIETCSVIRGDHDISIPSTIDELVQRVAIQMPRFLPSNCLVYSDVFLPCGIQIDESQQFYTPGRVSCWYSRDTRRLFADPFLTVFQNSLIRAYVDGHEAPYISEGTVKKITITFENLQRRQQWLTLTLHTPEGWEAQPGKTLAVNLEQGHCNVPLARVTLEITPHALSRARNDLIIQVVSEGRPTQLFIPIVLLASGDYQIFSE